MKFTFLLPKTISILISGLNLGFQYFKDSSFLYPPTYRVWINSDIFGYFSSWFFLFVWNLTMNMIASFSLLLNHTMIHSSLEDFPFQKSSRAFFNSRFSPILENPVIQVLFVIVTPFVFATKCVLLLSWHSDLEFIIIPHRSATVLDSHELSHIR